MTIYEMRLFAVFGLVAIGAIAILAALAFTALRDVAHRLHGRIAGGRTLPSLRGDAHDAARLIDRRQAAWRLRC